MEKQRNDLAVLQKNGLIHLIGKSENRIPEPKFKGGTVPWFVACIDKAKNDIAYINEKTHPQMYKEIGDIVFEMAMDTYGHYFSGIVVLVEVEPNTYKMIEK